MIRVNLFLEGVGQAHTCCRSHSVNAYINTQKGNLQ